MSDVLNIESLDLEARGIARREGKVVFVEGALPGERVVATTVRRKPSYEIARVEEILRPSSQRVVPRCPHFGVCGGCAMQHLEPSTQVAIKQRSLEDTFWHVGKLRPARVLPPCRARPGATATAPACRCGWCRRRAACWWASMSARAAMWPTCANAMCCRATSATCCCPCAP